MRKAEIITAFILGIFSLYLMWKSGEPPAWDPSVPRFANIGMIEGEGPGSGFWPFWLSFIMFLCTIWIAVNWFRGTSPQSRSDEPFLDAYGVRTLILVGGGLIGFLVAIGFVGFYGGMFLFLVYYLYFLGRHSITRTLAIAIGFPVFSKSNADLTSSR